MAGETTPYSSARSLISATALPSWLNEYDAQRLASYKLYEDIYWNVPETFRLTQRGSEANPILVPSGRIICNTINRYTGKNWTFVTDPAFGSTQEQTLGTQVLADLFKRERLGSIYSRAKLYGIIRGDWAFYITGDPEKPEGRRLTIRSIDPASMFPINPPDDVDRVWGMDIIEQVMDGDTLYIKRQRYLKSDHPDHPNADGVPGGPISYEKVLLEVENWEDEPKTYRVDTPPTLLPASITNLPVYHIKNIEEPGNPFGSSEMRGLERIMAGVNQSITDQELSLALEGLGMYATSDGQPTDRAGNPVPWQLGPGRVVHANDFKRVNGVGDVTPYLDHVNYLEDRMMRVNGASDVAQGIVDVTVAESGIALALRMGPILDNGEEKELGIRDTMDQFLYDLRFWLREYENVNLDNVRFNSRFGDKLPQDKARRFTELFQMATAVPPLISGAYFRDAVRELGYEIPENMGLEILQEQMAAAEVTDSFGARLNEEAGDDTGEEEPPEVE